MALNQSLLPLNFLHKISVAQFISMKKTSDIISYGHSFFSEYRINRSSIFMRIDENQTSPAFVKTIIYFTTPVELWVPCQSYLFQQVSLIHDPQGVYACQNERMVEITKSTFLSKSFNELPTAFRVLDRVEPLIPHAI